MKPLLWNLLLAVVWMALVGRFTLWSLIAGLAIGYAVVALADRAVGVSGSGPGAPRAVGVSGYGARVLRAVAFLVFYLWEVLLSNLRVAADVVRLRSRCRPAFIAIPVQGMTPTQITVLANLITMTPGTLSIDVSGDRSTLYIHAMFVDDADEVRRSIEHRLARRVRGVFP